MGLDIYVGTLSRYIEGDWETIVQQWAREQGAEMRVPRADPKPEDAITDPAVIGEAVEGWRAALASGLGRALEWDESADAPYFTDKPDFDGYGSVQVIAARVEPGDRAELGPSEGPFDDAARFGLAIMLELAERSVEHRLPLKLDY